MTVAIFLQRLFLLFWMVVLAATPALPQAIPSAVYTGNHSSGAEQTGYQEQTILEGTTRDFSHVTLQAITILANQPAQPTQALDEEAILIVKTGELTLTLGGKRKIAGPGSVVMIMPGDDYRVDNKAAQPLVYYRLRYTSNEMPDLDLYRLAGGSFWVDWQEVASTTDEQGSSRRMVACATVMSSRVALQVTKRPPGLWTQPPHTHRAAEILIILDHPVQARIEGVLKEAQVGDVIFVDSDVSHGIGNSRQEGSTYLSLQF